MRNYIIIACALLALALCGCGTTKTYTHTCFAMDTYVEMSAYGGDAEAALNSAEYELKKLEKLFSPTLAASDALRINDSAGGYVIVAHETADMLRTAALVSVLTDGVFDVTIGPLVELWGFETDTPALPSVNGIAEARERIDYRALELNGTTVRLKPGMRVSFGGIGKGAAADRISEIMAAHGVSGALINLGGNVQTVGTRPDGANWRVGIRNPLDEARVIGVVESKYSAIVTSGAYQRGFTENGVYYHHILDPKTGCPAKSGLTSATAITKSGTYADALSTALFVMGEQEAIALYRNLNDFEMVLVTDDNRVLYTEGAGFTPDAESGCQYEAIYR